MLHYHVGHNTPGYLPESDVSYCESAESAKDTLIYDLDYAWDSYYARGETPDEQCSNGSIADEYSAAMEDLKLASVENGWDVYLPTSTSEHDLGCHYWIDACLEDCEDEDAS
jgi:hypothetical protein